jgi:hypothetical protein
MADHPILKLLTFKQVDPRAYEKKLLGSVVGVIGLTLGLIIGVKAFMVPKKPDVLGIKSAVEHSPAPTSPIITMTPLPTQAAETVYRINIRKRENFERLDRPLDEIILNTLDPVGTLNLQLNGLFFDTRKGDPFKDDQLLSLDYYVVKQSGNLPQNQEYVLPTLTILISKADESLKPWLLNRTFCQKNADCVIRESYCTLGAFNYYDRLITSWACLEGKKSIFGTEYDVFDSQKQCTINLGFDGLTCQANTCKAGPEILSCK